MILFSGVPVFAHPGNEIAAVITLAGGLFLVVGAIYLLWRDRGS